MRQIGFPCNTPNSKAIGYFTDETFETTNSKGEKVSRTYTMLKHWVPGMSGDFSSTPCKDNEDGKKLRKEWSQAWAHYEKMKAATPTAPDTPTAVEYGIAGTPIEELTFLGKDQLARLKAIGLTTAEQLRDMSDTACNNVGFGARDWRRKAGEHLFVKQDEALRGVVNRAPIGGPQTAPNADMMAAMSKMQEQMAALLEQLSAANAKIAEMEAKADEPVAKPTRKRKAADVQAEA